MCKRGKRGALSSIDRGGTIFNDKGVEKVSYLDIIGATVYCTIGRGGVLLCLIRGGCPIRGEGRHCV